MNKFVEYYSGEIEKYGGAEKYILAKSVEKKKLIDKVKKYAMNKPILEAGCGSASNSIFLAKEGYEVSCLDSDKEMLKLARRNAEELDVNINFVNKSITDFTGKEFGVSFSHGTLEHYKDDEIIKLINSQLEVVEFVVVSVPSDFFKQKDAINGDERFLSKKHWKALISKTNGALIETFDYFYDSKNFKIKLLKIISFLTFDALPTKKPYIGFVIGRKKCI